MPERLGLPQEFDPGSAQWDGVSADLQNLPCVPDSRGGQLGKIAFAIRRQKVVDIVLTGIDAGQKRRPGDRRNGWNRGGQRAKGACIAKSGKMRQLALLHIALRKRRIHAIEAEDHDTLHSRFAISTASPNHAKGLAHRPGEKSKDGMNEGDKQRQERRQDRKSGPGTYIGLRAHRAQQAQRQSQSEHEDCSSEPHRLVCPIPLRLTHISVRKMPFSANAPIRVMTRKGASHSISKLPKWNLRGWYWTSIRSNGPSSGNGASPGCRNCSQRLPRTRCGEGRVSGVATRICLLNALSPTMISALCWPGSSA